MAQIKVDLSKASIQEAEVNGLQERITAAHEMLHAGTGKGNDFIGWVDLPVKYDKEEFERVKAAAQKIKDSADVLIVIGIGGSYLGSRAAIEALTHSFYNTLPKVERKTPEVYFAGNSISGKYLSDLIDVIKNKDVCLNVISKSGTTTEPAIAFRILKGYVEEKYGKEEAKNRIFATTDKEKGALRTLADQEGYETFVIPDNVGGRYSILTPVGLLPIAVAGIDIDAMMHGALEGCKEYENPNLSENTCYQYAAARNLLYTGGKKIEVMVNYEPSMAYISEWWKQLYGESDGKDGKGLFPASVNFSADLHSMGQYIQDGERHLFETVLNVEKAKRDIQVPFDEANLDNLNYLNEETMEFVNKKAFEGTLLAHVDGGVPNVVLGIPEMNAFYYGKLMYFFEKACGIGGYLMDINPFDQPGVEAYKKNMFALLGKPGFEDLRAELLKKL
jgi:glucose-6-phosphate isomerase